MKSRLSPSSRNQNMPIAKAVPFPRLTVPYHTLWNSGRTSGHRSVIVSPFLGLIDSMSLHSTLYTDALGIPDWLPAQVVADVPDTAGLIFVRLAMETFITVIHAPLFIPKHPSINSIRLAARRPGTRP